MSADPPYITHLLLDQTSISNGYIKSQAKAIAYIFNEFASARAYHPRPEFVGLLSRKVKNAVPEIARLAWHRIVHDLNGYVWPRYGTMAPTRAATGINGLTTRE